jgi:hypothetical protein
VRARSSSRTLNCCVESSRTNHDQGSLDRPDPQAEDFDDFARSVDPSGIQVVEAGSGAKVTIVADAAGEQAKRLERIARETDPPLEDVLADLRGAAKPNAA